MYYNL